MGAPRNLIFILLQDAYELYVFTNYGITGLFSTIAMG